MRIELPRRLGQGAMVIGMLCESVGDSSRDKDGPSLEVA